MGTIGICLTPCTLPGAKVSNFTLDKNEMALGLGVHGEAGVKNVEIRSSKDTVDLMLNHMMDKNSSSHLDLNDKDEVVLLINNLGGTTHLEIGIITDDVVKALTKRGVKVLKVFTGSYFTSLEMAGFNITVLRLSEKLKKENLLSLLEMETDTPVVLASTNCMSLIAVRDKLNEYDKCAGDGDCGTTLARGSEAILQDLDKLGDFKYPADIFQNISFSCSETMGGTSGGMYSVLMSGIARKLSTNDKFGLKSFSQAFEEGINSLMQYGGAKPGDRTMLDVLKPISEKLNSLAVKDGELPYDDIKSIALNSAERTLNLEAKSGRASYVSKDKLINPDPGAVAVAEIVKACVDVLKIKRI
ncbi:Triokinase/FMN cyclase [Armadillidium nasatum]|uniref:Triokinase/FMN cyclase n=1 Tax=Armadillidium nasatum TaxID=96803 RepID=A0A5N5TG20_9CRUS|nr:Triokinase/FMN cyclase [Armadillidium nasatum]